MTKEQLEILKGIAEGHAPMRYEVAAIRAAIAFLSRWTTTKDGVYMCPEDLAWCIYDGNLCEEEVSTFAADMYSTKEAASAALAAEKGKP